MSHILNPTWLRAGLLAASVAFSGIPHSGFAAASAIAIDNFTFNPPMLTVPPGTEVTWTNRDDIPHLVQMVDAAKLTGGRSQPLDTGDHFSFTFTGAGTYRYFCALHPMMTGTVVVR